MESLQLDDVKVIFESEINEISFIAPRFGSKDMIISFTKEDLDKLIPWLQSKITEME